MLDDISDNSISPNVSKYTIRISNKCCGISSRVTPYYSPLQNRDKERQSWKGAHLCITKLAKMAQTEAGKIS